MQQITIHGLEEFLREQEERLMKKIESAIHQPAAVTQTEIINRTELMKRLDITEPTVIKWQKKGKIPFLQIGSHIRYNWYAVLNALEK